MSGEGHYEGLGGGSASTSRRGSASSIASSSSDAVLSTVSSSMGSVASGFLSSGIPTTKFVNRPPVFTVSEKEKERKANKALMVVTHPELEGWHKESIRSSVGEYGIGVVFIPLGENEEEEDLPLLKPLDPRTMTSFGSFMPLEKPPKTLDEEIILRVDNGGNTEEIIEDIVSGVNEILQA
jgi:hypothetical protein